MAKRLKYNQTQLLECISKLPHTNFVENNKKVLNLLFELQNGVEMDSESILSFDIETLNQLDEHINNAFSRTDNGNNPVLDIVKASDAKLSIQKIKPTVSCATDMDFF